MTGSPLHVLPNPIGSPPAPSGNTFTIALELDPSGTYLAQTYIHAGAAAPGLAIYSRSGDQFTRGTVAGHDDARRAINLAWSPDGRYLVTATTAGWNGADRRLWVYRRTGGNLQVVGPGPDAVQTGGVGYPTKDILAFDPTGAFLAVADTTGGWSGMLAFSDGHLSVADRLPDNQVAVAWNPAQPTMLASLDQFSEVNIYRRTGSRIELQSVMRGEFLGLAFHPAGTALFTTAVVNCYTYCPMAYGFPDGHWQGALLAFNGQAAGWAIDPTGVYLAGGFVLAEGADVFNPAFEGLTLAALDPARGKNGDTEYAGYALLDRLPDAQQAAGTYCSWGKDGDALYLAAGSWPAPSFYSVDDVFDSADYWQSAWGFRTYRIGVGINSTLRMRQPSGEHTLVGTAEHPLGMTMPDGTIRRWPGSTAPLSMRMPDGTWRKVIG